MKPFCYHQIRTKDNPNGLDCTAHMSAARIFECSCTSAVEAETKCIDYRLAEGSHPQESEGKNG